MNDLIAQFPCYTCERCEHTWQPRVGTPLKCPKCQTLHWRREEENMNNDGEEPQNEMKYENKNNPLQDANAD